MSEESKSAKKHIGGILIVVAIIAFVALIVVAVSGGSYINKSVSTTEQFLELAGEKYITWSASGHSSSKLRKVNLKSDLDFKGKTIEIENAGFIDADKDFNGNGHTIKNLNVNFTCTADNGSVFFIDAANVTDLNFENCSFTYLGQQRFTIIHAFGATTKEHCVRNVNFISGELKAPYAKTVAPIAADDIVEECENRMKIEGGDFTAGVASMTCMVRNCANYGEVIGKKCVGGIGTIIDSGGASSHDEPIIYNCVNKGSVKGTENVGGILGASFTTRKEDGSYSDTIPKNNYSSYTYYTKKIENCKNEGDVNGNERVGGIVGYSLCVVVSCENKGNVTAIGNEAGGIIGKLSIKYDVAYSNNVNSGKISGNEYVGGIYGYAVHSYGGTSDSSKITNIITRNVNTGEVLGNEYVGGIIGYYISEYRYVKLNITYCENSGEITSQTYAAGIVGCAVLGKNEFSCDSTNQNYGSLNGTSYEDLYNTGSK